MSEVVAASLAASCGRTVRDYRAVGSELDTAASARPSGPQTAHPTAVTRPRSAAARVVIIGSWVATSRRLASRLRGKAQVRDSTRRSRPDD